MVETKETENIAAQSISASAAFEYFHGKIYESSQRKSMFKFKLLTIVGLKTEYSLADRVEKRIESPFQRFARLRAEVAELQGDVAVMIQVDYSLVHII